MFAGEHINSTEDRAVLHVATRARRDQVRLRRANPPRRVRARGACVCLGSAAGGRMLRCLSTGTCCVLCGVWCG
jgi:glucose-6-phosphate isomerase